MRWRVALRFSAAGGSGSRRPLRGINTTTSRVTTPTAGTTRRAGQQADYDPAILDWIFWWYLATVELTNRIISRQNDSSARQRG